MIRAFNLKKKGENNMREQKSELQGLAVRARQGDQHAGMTLHRHLESQLTCIVRRALCFGDAKNQLTRRILAEARLIDPGACVPRRDTPGDLIGAVARRLADAVRANVSGVARCAVDTVVGV